MEEQPDNEPEVTRPWVLNTIIVLIVAAIVFFNWYYLQKKNYLPLPNNTPVVTPKVTPSPITSGSANTETTTNLKEYNVTIQASPMGIPCDSVKLSFSYPNNYDFSSEAANSNNPYMVLVKLTNPSSADYIKFPDFNERIQQEQIEIKVGQNGTGGCDGVDQWKAYKSDYDSLLKHYQGIYNDNAGLTQIVDEPKKIDINGHEAIQFTFQGKRIYEGTPLVPANPHIMISSLTRETVITNNNEPAVNIQMSRNEIKNDNGDDIYPDVTFSTNSLNAYNTIVNSVIIK